MKHIILTIACFCSFALSACGETPGKDVVMVDSIKWNQMELKIDSLSKLNDQLLTTIDELQSKQEASVFDNHPTIIFVLIILGLLGLVSALYVYFCLNSLHNEFSHEIQYLERKLGECDQSIKKMGSNTKVSTSSKQQDYLPSKEMQEISRFEKRLAALEKTLSKGVPAPSKVDSNNKRTTTSEECVAYLSNPIGTDTEKYFKDVLSSKSDIACFRLFVKNETEATYELLELQRVKSADWFDRVITTNGCSIDEANTFETKERGKLVKSENCWKVKDPTVIKLKK